MVSYININNIGGEVHVLSPITRKMLDSYTYEVPETNKMFQLKLFWEEDDREDMWCMYSLKGTFIAYVNDDYIKIKLDDTYVVVEAFRVFQNKDDMDNVADGMLYLFRDFLFFSQKKYFQRRNILLCITQLKALTKDLQGTKQYVKWKRIHHICMGEYYHSWTEINLFWYAD